VAAALEIIWRHDADDYRWAKADYAEQGTSGHFVLTHRGAVAGVTGCWPDPAADRTYWLSWTYLHTRYRGQGKGRYMLDCLIDRLAHTGARKVFVSTSDYVNKRRQAIYRPAIRLYQALGFSQELTHADYYAPGESQIILGMRLSAASPMPMPEADPGGIVLKKPFRIIETRDVWSLDWQWSQRSAFDAPRLREVLTLAGAQGARVVFFAHPSQVESIVAGPLEAVGFTPAGKLKNYHADGIDQCHHRVDAVQGVRR
jgi:ribosomal protein S18 acetylase RimI-like enzyme